MNSEVAIFFINALIIVGRIIVYALIARIIFSWLSMNKPEIASGPVARILYDITEPILNVVRLIPHRFGMLDFAPLIAILLIDFLNALLIRLIS